MTLTIKKDRICALDKELTKDFKPFAIEQLRAFFPDAFLGQSDEEIGAYVDKGVERAKSYGANTNDAFGLFLALTVLFDVPTMTFDKNPQFKWLEDALKDKAIENPDERMKNAYFLALNYLQIEPEAPSTPSGELKQ